MAQPIIIDTDPGIDDTMAILFALRSPELQVLGLTTIFGNAHTETTTRNARRVLELVGAGDIPVARGPDVPLVRKYSNPPTFVHGHDGLGDGGVTAEPERWALEMSAAQFIVQNVMARPGEITLVPVGPLTNIALALRLEPRLAQAVKQVVIMGGAFLAPGNVSPVAEANIQHDSEAADIVFTAPWDLVMVGLDVTTRTVMDAAFLDSLAAARNPYTDIISHIVPVYQKFHDDYYGMHGGIHTHDPSAIAYVIDPTLFKTAHYAAHVAREGYADGQVIADRLGRFYAGPKTAICVEVDAPRLLTLFKERLTA